MGKRLQPLKVLGGCQQLLRGLRGKTAIWQGWPLLRSGYSFGEIIMSVVTGIAGLRTTAQVKATRSDG